MSSFSLIVAAGVLAGSVSGCATLTPAESTASAPKPRKVRFRPVRDVAILNEITSEARSLAKANGIKVAKKKTIKAPPAPKTAALPAAKVAPNAADAPNAAADSNKAPTSMDVAATEKASVPAATAAPQTDPSPTLPTPLSGGEARNELKKTAASAPASGVPPGSVSAASEGSPGEPLTRLRTLDNSHMELSSASETPLIFDIPVTYNERVRYWINFFQTRGRATFKNWLERSSRYMPYLQYELTKAGLPLDLAYVAMIESGFVPHALSHANAMGMWQFIAPTGRRYDLKIDWWIDERKDFQKSTLAAIRYMSDLHKLFNSWYLVAASYNMGENGVRRLIRKHGTNNFWELADRNALPAETRDYVPKILAAVLISKAPALYGFRDLNYQMPLAFEMVTVPGGTDLINLASYLGVSESYMKELNPELLKNFVPRTVAKHKIRVPKGATMTVSKYVQEQKGGRAF